MKKRYTNLQWLLPCLMIMAFAITFSKPVHSKAPNGTNTEQTLIKQEGFYLDNAVHSLSNLLQDENMNTNEYHLFSHGRSGELLIDGQWLNANKLVTWIQQNNLLEDNRTLVYTVVSLPKAKKEKPLFLI